MVHNMSYSPKALNVTFVLRIVGVPSILLDAVQLKTYRRGVKILFSTKAWMGHPIQLGMNFHIQHPQLDTQIAMKWT